MAKAHMSSKIRALRIKQFEELAAKAIETLDAPGHTFTDYMHALDELGAFAHELTNNDEIEFSDTDFPKGSIKLKGKTTRVDEQVKDKGFFAAAFLSRLYNIKLDKSDKTHFKFELPTHQLQIIHNGFRFRVFEAVWEDDALREKQERQLAEKANINRSIRRRINLGKLLLANVIHMKFVQETNPATVALRHKEAAAAISGFKTPLQKVLTGIGKIFTVAVGITFGLTTAAAILLTFGFTPVWIAVAATVFVCGSVTNIFIFDNPVYSFLNNIFGKDKLFEGLTHYVDENGEKQQLSWGKIAALAVLSLLAVSVGISGAALTYSLLSGLAVFAISFAAFFPPVAFALAAVACICLTALMLGDIALMLQAKSFSSIITAPFSKVKDVFSKLKNPEENGQKSETRLTIERVITYGVTGIITALALFGLVMNSLASQVSFANFLVGSFSVAANIATGVSYAVIMAIALAGQIPFILGSASRAVANVATIFRDKLAPEPKYSAVDLSPGKKAVKKAVASEGTGFFARVGSFLDNTAKLVNAFGNAVLVIPAIKTLGSVIFAYASGVGAGFQSLCAGIASARVPTEVDKKKQKSSAYCINLLLADAPDKVVPLPPERSIVLKADDLPIEDALAESSPPHDLIRRANRRYSSIAFANANRKFEEDRKEYLEKQKLDFGGSGEAEEAEEDVESEASVQNGNGAKTPVAAASTSTSPPPMMRARAASK